MASPICTSPGCTTVSTYFGPEGAPEWEEGKTYGSPKGPDDEGRVKALRDCGILDLAPQPNFDSVTRLAADLLKFPICLISLVDADRQWFLSRQGLAAPETPQSQAFCAYLMLPDAPDLLVVPNASTDRRFKNNPLVTGPPNIMFYAGAPVYLADGTKAGTLCVIDTVTRTFAQKEMTSLIDMAGLVSSQIQLRQARERCAKLESEQEMMGSKSIAAVDASSPPGPLRAVRQLLDRVMGRQEKSASKVYP